jgi:hypothetical protein
VGRLRGTRKQVATRPDIPVRYRGRRRDLRVEAEPLETAGPYGKEGLGTGRIARKIFGSEARPGRNRMPVRAPVTEPETRLAGKKGKHRAPSAPRMVRRTMRPRAGESGVGSNTGPICLLGTRFPAGSGFSRTGRFPEKIAVICDFTEGKNHRHILFCGHFGGEPPLASDKASAGFGTVNSLRLTGLNFRSWEDPTCREP